MAVIDSKIANKLENKTIRQYDAGMKRAKDVFLKKTKDYGTAWRILRLSSLTDQIFIKAQRIRTIEEKGQQKINEEIDQEFIGIVNYGIMALIQQSTVGNPPSTGDSPQSTIDSGQWTIDEVAALYDQKANETKKLMLDKNHDYGEAWRDMRISSFTDLILMKILRIKQIEDNQGKTLISEGVDAGFADIVNYAIFALIKLSEIRKNNYNK